MEASQTTAPAGSEACGRGYGLAHRLSRGICSRADPDMAQMLHSNLDRRCEFRFWSVVSAPLTEAYRTIATVGNHRSGSPDARSQGRS